MAHRKLLAVSVCVTLLSALLGAQSDPETLIKQKHFKRARVLLERRLAANPKDVSALVTLAGVEAEFKNNDAAIKLASEAISLQPGNAQAHAILAQSYGQKTDENIGMFAKLRLARSFKKEVEQALSIDPRNLDALWGMMIFDLEAPGMVGGDKSRAPEFADRIMAVDVDRGYLAKQELAKREKKSDQFAALVIKAAEANSHSYEALARLAGFYSSGKSKNLAQAASLAMKAVQLDKGRAEAYDVLARIYAEQEQWHDLDQLLQTAEKAVPDDSTPYYQAGRVLLGTGKDNSRAERYFRKYLIQDPEPGMPALAHAHWRLGLVLEKQGNKPQAIKELETALHLMPGLKPAENDLKRIKS